MSAAGLFLTHTWSSRIKRHFNRLVRETDGEIRWHLHYSESHAASAAENALPRRFKQMQLNDGLQGGLMDAAIWPWLISFYADFIWIIEYDVDFSGDWAKLFGQFGANTADLLTTTIIPRSQSDDWFWWKSAGAPPHVLPEQMHRSFLPIMRVSHRFAREYARSMEDPGWRGHYESTIPTVAISAGLVAEDIGGDGPFCPDARRNRNYRNSPGDWCLSPGTFVWRPPRGRYFVEAPETFPEADLLYHPVKADVPEWRKEFAQDP